MTPESLKLDKKGKRPIVFGWMDGSTTEWSQPFSDVGTMCSAQLSVFDCKCLVLSGGGARKGKAFAQNEVLIWGRCRGHTDAMPWARRHAGFFTSCVQGPCAATRLERSSSVRHAGLVLMQNDRGRLRKHASCRQIVIVVSPF